MGRLKGIAASERGGIAGKAIEQAAPHAEGKRALVGCCSRELDAGAHHRILSQVDAICTDTSQPTNDLSN
ncbi:hypothetical protein D8I24_5797 [Cupriavidus necator H850]|nr:hypothetical protein D8I24_5797 [Cupriavidus necator H850]